MKKTLRSDTIKIIAMVLMVIDHIGLAIFEPIYLTSTDYNTVVTFYYLRLIFTAFGRVAFPLFAYQLMRGFFYTRNRMKHVLTLLVFALITEVPFDLFNANEIINFTYQNVLFTLLLGTIMMCALDMVNASDLFNDKDDKKGRILGYSVQAFIIVIFSCAAVIIKCDYTAKGIILIAILYYARNEKSKLITLAPVLFIADIFFVTLLLTRSLDATINYCEIEIYAVVAFFIMYLDNGERKGGKALKWMGYAFYPLHMLALYFISPPIIQHFL